MREFAVNAGTYAIHAVALTIAAGLWLLISLLTVMNMAATFIIPSMVIYYFL